MLACLVCNKANSSCKRTRTSGLRLYALFMHCTTPVLSLNKRMQVSAKLCGKLLIAAMTARNSRSVEPNSYVPREKTPRAMAGASIGKGAEGIVADD